MGEGKKRVEFDDSESGSTDERNGEEEEESLDSEGWIIEHSCC